jgi:hypothetical protein
MKNTYSDLNKIIFIKKNYLKDTNNSKVDNKDTNFYLLSDKEYNINKLGKA